MGLALQALDERAVPDGANPVPPPDDGGGITNPPSGSVVELEAGDVVSLGRVDDNEAFIAVTAEGDGWLQVASPDGYVTSVLLADRSGGKVQIPPGTTADAPLDGSKPSMFWNGSAWVTLPPVGGNQTSGPNSHGWTSGGINYIVPNQFVPPPGGGQGQLPAPPNPPAPVPQPNKPPVQPPANGGNTTIRIGGNDFIIDNRGGSIRIELPNNGAIVAPGGGQPVPGRPPRVIEERRNGDGSTHHFDRSSGESWIIQPDGTRINLTPPRTPGTN